MYTIYILHCVYSYCYVRCYKLQVFVNTYIVFVRENMTIYNLYNLLKLRNIIDIIDITIYHYCYIFTIAVTNT